MANCFIVTGQGFVKGSTFNMETKQTEVNYTNTLRTAQQFTSKSAVNYLKSHGLIGFVYNPYKEEPIRDMYEVRKKSQFNTYDDEKNNLQEFYVSKAMMKHNTDVSFLHSRKLVEQDLLTFEEAKAKAIDLNAKMLLELSNKIKEQVNLEPDKLWKQ